MKLGTVVEGHGEVEAVPILVRRIVEHVAPDLRLHLPPPLKVSRGQLVKEPELRRAIELSARRAGPGAPVLVLLDADDDPACRLGPALLAWARDARSDRRISVVLAVREFEAWFLAAASSLAGRRTLPADLEDVPDAEARGGPKGWLDHRMEHGYAETLEQPKLAAALDLARARKADSFDKLFREVSWLVEAPCPPR